VGVNRFFIYDVLVVVGAYLTILAAVFLIDEVLSIEMGPIAKSVGGSMLAGYMTNWSYENWRNKQINYVEAFFPALTAFGLINGVDWSLAKIDNWDRGLLILLFMTSAQLIVFYWTLFLTRGRTMRKDAERDPR
jgi:hypothetical protein